MSSELRLKKLRGSGGYVMANIGDDQQMKGNLGGPDLFLAPIGRLPEDKISKHYCNTCEKEFEGSPNIQYEAPNEVVAENLVLAERGQYLCNSCSGVIAEFRAFKKQDETADIGSAKPLEPETTQQVQIEPKVQAPPEVQVEPEITQQVQAESVTQPSPADSVSSIEGKAVYDENANLVGKAKQVGIDSNQSVVLLITKNDGVEASIPWNSIKKIGAIILLGNPEQPQEQSGRCTSCGFTNKEGSKFCEECGSKLPS